VVIPTAYKILNAMAEWGGWVPAHWDARNMILGNRSNVWRARAVRDLEAQGLIERAVDTMTENRAPGYVGEFNEAWAAAGIKDPWMWLYAERITAKGLECLQAARKRGYGPAWGNAE
jgi:hypothetical protein